MLTVRREKIECVHTGGVYEIVPMQDYEDAIMKLLELMRVDTDKSAREHKRKTQGKIKRTLLCFSVVLCNATSRSCEGASLNHDVGEFFEQEETIEVETLRHHPRTFSRNSPETPLRPSASRRSSEIW